MAVNALPMVKRFVNSGPAPFNVIYKAHNVYYVKNVMLYNNFILGASHAPISRQSRAKRSPAGLLC